MRRRRKVKETAMPEMVLTPLIDTVLVLLITFMVAMPVVHNAITVELPTSATNDVVDKEKTKEQESLTVFIDAHQKLYLGDQPISYKMLAKELDERLARMHDRRGAVVYVNADKKVPYGAVIAVVDDIKYLGGVKYVALATEHEKA